MEDWAMEFDNGLTLTFCIGDGVGDGLWLTNEESEGLRIEESHTAFADLLAEYFKENF